MKLADTITAAERREMRALGERLGVALRQKGMKQAELAAAVATSDSTVSRWRAGTGPMSALQMRRIAAVLGRPMSWWYGEVGEEGVELAERWQRLEATVGLALDLVVDALRTGEEGRRVLAQWERRAAGLLLVAGSLRNGKDDDDDETSRASGVFGHLAGGVSGEGGTGGDAFSARAAAARGDNGTLGGAGLQCGDECGRSGARGSRRRAERAAGNGAVRAVGGCANLQRGPTGGGDQVAVTEPANE